MDYDELLCQAYEEYKEFWCNARGCIPEEYDEEDGFNGEFYVSKDEFEDNEFRDEDVMQEVLSLELYLDWCAVSQEGGM